MTSVDKDVTTAGRVVAAEYVPVQPEDDGSVKHDLTVVMSVDNVDTDAILTGMELLELKIKLDLKVISTTIIICIQYNLTFIGLFECRTIIQGFPRNVRKGSLQGFVKGEEFCWSYSYFFLSSSTFTSLVPSSL